MIDSSLSVRGESDDDAPPGTEIVQLDINAVEQQFISAVKPVHDLALQAAPSSAPWLDLWLHTREAARTADKLQTMIGARNVHQKVPDFFFADNIWKHPFGYYSQHEQDLVIEAFFNARAPKAKFFVDVGGFDPFFLSNSRRLINQGWGGVVIEPMPAPAARWRNNIPGNRVRVAECAVGPGPGRLTLYETEWPGMEPGGAITCFHGPQVSRGLWKRHPIDEPSWVLGASAGTETIILPEPFAVDVECKTLDDVLGDCGPIDLLLVDIELAEEAMFTGFSVEKYRPTMIVIETVRPATHARLSSAGYRPLARGKADYYYVLAECLD